MRASGDVVAAVHRLLRDMIAPGVTTRDLDSAAHEYIVAAGGTPSFLGYRGYPASICASINDVVLHGIPSDRALQEGDIISIDVAVRLNGYHADAAFTVGVGEITEAARGLIEVTEGSFWQGFNVIVGAERLGDVGAAVQAFAESRGYGVIREYTGHGVGRSMHEDPSVPNWGTPGTGARIRNGMTFALEPMLAIGDPDTRVLADKWTVEMADGSLAAHYEHTIAVVEGKPIVLTDGAGSVV
jgi:methionyl aminopeptidase